MKNFLAASAALVFVSACGGSSLNDLFEDYDELEVADQVDDSDIKISSISAEDFDLRAIENLDTEKLETKVSGLEDEYGSALEGDGFTSAAAVPVEGRAEMLGVMGIYDPDVAEDNGVAGEISIGVNFEDNEVYGEASNFYNLDSDEVSSVEGELEFKAVIIRETGAIRGDLSGIIGDGTVLAELDGGFFGDNASAIGAEGRGTYQEPGEPTLGIEAAFIAE
ncbi:MAG: hypothetical protein R6V30_03360 [Paracoccaceae bacterium]